MSTQKRPVPAKPAEPKRPANQKHSEPASIKVLEIDPATPAKPPVELSHTHELIIAAVSTMLTAGGHTKDVDGLIRSTMAHTERTWQWPPDDDPAQDRRVADFITRDFSEWKADLVVAWRQSKRPERAEPDAAASISERVRFHARESVWRAFENFMGGASSEELVVMLSLLEVRESRSLPAKSKRDEIYLASAMENELGGYEQKYLKIPESMVDAVQRYVNALRAVEGKAA